MGRLSDCDSYDLLEFAESYAELGGSVQDQLRVILDANPDRFKDEVNPNAVDLIEEKLGGMHEDIDAAIEEYREWYEGGEEDEEEEDEEEAGG